MSDQPESALAAELRRNRSYAIRTVRMSPHQRDAFAALYDRYCLPIDHRFDRATAFPQTGASRARPLILDVGFGMGIELAQLAERYPDRDYLGVEIHRPGIGRLMGRLHERNLSNVKIYHGDAIVVLDRVLGVDSVDGLHLFFPDPWPKKRHHKRRWVRPGFPEWVAGLCATDGTGHGALSSVRGAVRHAGGSAFLARPDGVRAQRVGQGPRDSRVLVRMLNRMNPDVLSTTRYLISGVECGMFRIN